MKGTHGSARATSTLGFVASNTDRLPPTLRAEEVYPWFGLSREPEPRRPPADRGANGRAPAGAGRQPGPWGGWPGRWGTGPLALLWYGGRR